MTQNQGNHYPDRYFMPGEVILLAEHVVDGTLSNDDTLGQLNEQIRQLSDGAMDANTAQALSALIAAMDERTNYNLEQPVLTFPREQRKPFSLITVRNISINNAVMEDDDLALLINHLYDRLQLGPDLQGKVKLRAVTPNWLGGGAPVGCITGGPASKPVPHSGLPAPWEFYLEALDSLEGGASSVEIAILDTAPSVDAITAARGAPWAQEHPLFQSLLAEDWSEAKQTLLRITYAENYHNFQPGKQVEFENAYLEDHNYPMFDHGPFIAGIIRSIAPDARLHLVEVLNQKGVGTIDSFARGLKYVLDNRSMPDAVLIVNCSFTFTIPLWGHSQYNLALKRLADDYCFVQQMSWPINWICNEFCQQQEMRTLVVAAAGNDAWPGVARPQARYPAAFSSVIGVGALSKNSQVAAYSNFADEPINQGISTFGGDVIAVGNTLVADPTSGVLGVYIGEFPAVQDTVAPSHNTTGWARWAGTSFATPVISAALAKVIGSGVLPAQALTALFNTRIETTPGQQVLTVVQGP